MIEARPAAAMEPVDTRRLTIVIEPSSEGTDVDEPTECLARELSATAGCDVPILVRGHSRLPDSGHVLLQTSLASAARWIPGEQLRRCFFLDAYERAPDLLKSLETFAPAGAVASDDYWRYWSRPRNRGQGIRVYGLRSVAISLGLRFSEDGPFTSEHYVPFLYPHSLPRFLALYLPACDA